MTPRLRLEALTVSGLQALAAGRASRVVDSVDFHVPDPALLPTAAFARQRQDLVRENPVQLAWIHRSIVLRSTATLIGTINFHHLPPDPFLLPYSSHAVELGYTVAAEHRCRGYATEALQGMMDWARATAGVRAFFLSISPDNTASLRLALKLGFRQVGEQHDEVDGLEWIFRRDLPPHSPHARS